MYDFVLVTLFKIKFWELRLDLLTTILGLYITVAITIATLASLLTLFKQGEKFNKAELLDFRGIVLSMRIIKVTGQ